jgi:hypothetical protein
LRPAGTLATLRLIQAKTDGELLAQSYELGQYGHKVVG